MRSLVRLLIVLLLCLIGVGLYRGWFSLSRSIPGADGNKVNVNFSVDKGKMKSDVKQARTKVKEEISELRGNAKAKEAK
jgi:hypothetical protein